MLNQTASNKHDGLQPSFDQNLLNIRKLSVLNENNRKTKIKPFSLETLDEAPKSTEQQKIMQLSNQRENILRTNSIFFPQIENVRRESRKPSFFSTYMKFRQFKRNSMLKGSFTQTKKQKLKPFEVISKEKAEDIINKILKKQVEDRLSGQLICTANEIQLIRLKLKTISTLIKDEIKMYCDENHFRVIVNCTLGELKQQGLIIASKCFWDEVRDKAITVKFIHNCFFLLVNVFIIFRD